MVLTEGLHYDTLRYAPLRQDHIQNYAVYESKLSFYCGKSENAPNPIRSVLFGAISFRMSLDPPDGTKRLFVVTRLCAEVCAPLLQFHI